VTTRWRYRSSLERRRARKLRGARPAIAGLRGTGTGENYPNYPEALQWLLDTAIQGDYLAQAVVVQWYELGIGMQEPDPDQAARWKNTLEQNPVHLANQEQMRQVRFMRR
jgi:TPR repeat protein